MILPSDGPLRDRKRIRNMKKWECRFKDMRVEVDVGGEGGEGEGCCGTEGEDRREGRGGLTYFRGIPAFISLTFPPDRDLAIFVNL
jgi:hypothetical protein